MKIKIKKILPLILVIMMVMLIIPQVFAEDNTTLNTVSSTNNTILTSNNNYYVSPSGDDNNNGTSDYPFKTISHAINQNTINGGGSTIHISNGTYNENNLNINTSVNFIGENLNTTIINGNGGKMFEVTGLTTEANFNNLTFINGVNIYGGAINAEDGGDITINNCKFINNTAKINGGALANGKSLKVYNTIFLNNTANNKAGAINTYGYPLTVNNCYFKGNSVNKDGKDGGAINTQNNAQTLISNSTFENNSAPWGGAIMIFKDRTTIQNCTFLSNNAYEYGGSIYLDGEGTLTGNIMINNTSPIGLNIYVYREGSTLGTTNLTFIFNSTLKTVLNQNINLTATLTDDMGNTITNGEINFKINGVTIGSAISNEGVANFEYTPNTIGTYTISGNYVGTSTTYPCNLKTGLLIVKSNNTEDKILYVSPNGSDTTGTGSEENPYKTISYTLSIAPNDCVIYLKNGKYYESNLNLSKNLNIQGEDVNKVIIDAVNTNGSILTINTENVNISNISFINANALKGGAILINYLNRGIISNCAFKNNTANMGGAIYSNSSNLTIKYSIFNGNNGKIGNNIYNLNCPNCLNADYNWWTTNNISNINNYNIKINNWIIATINSTSNPIINGVSTNIIISLNQYTNGTITYKLNTTLPDCNVKIYSTNGNINPQNGQTSNNQFISNYKNNNIGKDNIQAIVDNQILNLNLTIVENTDIIYISPKGDDGSGDGTIYKPYATINKGINVNRETGGNKTIKILAGTYNEHNLIINETLNIIGENQYTTIINGENNNIFTINGNTTQVLFSNLTLINGNNRFGGAIDSTGGDIIILSSIFKNNTATINGGAIANGKTLTINNCIFINNTAENKAGAINSNGYPTNINNSIFINNTAKTKDGGAINMEYSSQINITNSTFNNNKAPWGGAICIYKSTGNITNSTFNNNTATEFGGTIYARGELILNNNTITEGTSPTGANIYITNDTTIKLINLIFENNQTLTSPKNQNLTLIVKVSDDNGNTITGGQVTFTVNGTIIETSEINEGIGEIPYTPNQTGELLISGYYTQSLTNNTQYKLSTGKINITKETYYSTILNGENFTETYTQGLNYTIQLTDLNGNPIIGKHITLNLTKPLNGKSKIYYVTTDTQGYGNLQINLAPGNYIVKAEYTGENQYLSSQTNNTITVKPNTITTVLSSNKFLKTYGAGENFTGRLTDTLGNPIIGQHIALNLTRLSNGLSKVYWVTTDTNGEYQLAINLGIGQYTAQCTYTGTSVYESNISNASLTVI